MSDLRSHRLLIESLNRLSSHLQSSKFDSSVLPILWNPSSSNSDLSKPNFLSYRLINRRILYYPSTLEFVHSAADTAVVAVVLVVVAAAVVVVVALVVVIVIAVVVVLLLLLLLML